MPDTVPFTLPRGYRDQAGRVHREGVMRRATARDEIDPLCAAEVRANEAYLAVLLLARTVTRIGEVTDVTPSLIEGLWAIDFGHLLDLYDELNGTGRVPCVVRCPHCQQELDVEVDAAEWAVAAG